MQQAKANRDKAKADAKASRKSQDAAADAREDKMDADYKVAKEKCDALSGDSKDACIASAKASFTSSVAEASWLVPRCYVCPALNGGWSVFGPDIAPALSTFATFDARGAAVEYACRVAEEAILGEVKFSDYGSVEEYRACTSAAVSRPAPSWTLRSH